MGYIEKIKILCAEKGITISKLEKDLGYSNASISAAKSLKAERLFEIANYLGTTMEYLMTGDISYHQPSPKIYERLMKDAHKESIHPDEIRVVLDFIKKIRTETLKSIKYKSDATYGFHLRPVAEDTKLYKDDGITFVGIYTGSMDELKKAELLWRKEEEYEVLRLSEIAKQIPGEPITVIIENPLEGRILRYGNHGDSWEETGSLCGYA